MRQAIGYQLFIMNFCKESCPSFTSIPTVNTVAVPATGNSKLICHFKDKLSHGDYCRLPAAEYWLCAGVIEFTVYKTMPLTVVLCYLPLCYLCNRRCEPGCVILSCLIFYCIIILSQTGIKPDCILLVTSRFWYILYMLYSYRN